MEWQQQQRQLVDEEEDPWVRRDNKRTFVL
jgi:hypothetical protein